jgi:hypothetical protein
MNKCLCRGITPQITNILGPFTQVGKRIIQVTFIGGGQDIQVEMVLPRASFKRTAINGQKIDTTPRKGL